MDEHVVSIGGSVAGLGVALGLAKRGFRVTIVERDPGPETNDGDEAFNTWQRRHVPQFRQPHLFSARTLSLLLEHAPEVVDRLQADGVGVANFFKELAPKELWMAADDAFDGLMSRRPAFELALRRSAEADPAITFVCPAQVSGLVVRDASTPVVTGLRLDDGSSIDADVVLDCAGRRTLVPGWLAAAGVEVPYESQDCETTYHSRYFRLQPGSELRTFTVIMVNTEIVGAVQLLGIPGDHGTFGLNLGTQPGDDQLAPLRRNDGFAAALSVFPSLAPWIDPANATPINDVAVMGGSLNIRRHYVVDDRPLVLGVLPIGDSLCSTNPTYGWGASMALTYAFAAVDAIDAHRGDLESMALAYEAAVRSEADGVYRESAAADRYRSSRWQGLDVPDDDAAEMERQDLIAQGVLRGAPFDPVLGRALLRRAHLVERPDQIFDDAEVLERATWMRDLLRDVAAAQPGPTRDDLIAAITAPAPERSLQD